MKKVPVADGFEHRGGGLHAVERGVAALPEPTEGSNNPDRREKFSPTAIPQDLFSPRFLSLLFSSFYFTLSATQEEMTK